MHSLLIAVLPLLALPVLSIPQNELSRGLAVSEKTDPYTPSSALGAPVGIEDVSKSHPARRAIKRSLPPCPEGQVRKSSRKNAKSPDRSVGKVAAMSQGDDGTPNKAEAASIQTTAAEARNEPVAVFKEIKLLASAAAPARESTTTPVIRPTTSSPQAVVSTNGAASLSSPIDEHDISIEPRSGKRNVLYVPTWSQDITSDTIPVDNVTHLLYAFACPHEKTGIVSYKDAYRLSQHLSQLYQFKNKYRNLKTLLSIGGDGCSGKFAFANDEAKRKEFTRSAVELMVDGSFDGLDIDWESTTKKEQLVELLTECRKELNRLTKEHNPPHPFLLTAATQVDTSRLNLTAMNTLLDYWFVMTYDFEGTWSLVASHHASLARSKKFIQERYGKIPPSKVHLGLPLYGKRFKSKGWKKTAAPFGEEEKYYTELYRNLPKPGAKANYDEENVGAYSVDETEAEVFSYDNPKSVSAKAAYINEAGLGGAFFWESNGDRSGNQSLVRLMSEHLGPLEQYQNWINPDFKSPN